MAWILKRSAASKALRGLAMFTATLLVAIMAGFVGLVVTQE